MSKILKYKEVIFIIILIIVVFIISIYFIKNNNNTINDTNTNNTILNSSSNNVYSIVLDEGTVKFKAFSPLKNGYMVEGYDFMQDMIYQDKIYHKKISTYDGYLVYKERWNDIYELSKEDFDDYFMIITAIENTSMLGLTLSNIVEIDSDTLNLYLDEYSENTQYNEEETCISIIVPKNMDRENIIIERLTTAKTRNLYSTNIPVSNSDAPDGSYVFSSFNVLKTENSDLSDMLKQGDFYKKKITTYEEYLIYKKKWSGIRELTNKDFVHYYLLLVLNEDVSKKYSFRKADVDKILLYQIDKNANIHELSYTGISIVIPNEKIMDVENIGIVKEDEYELNPVKITESQAKDIALKALKEDNITTWDEMSIEERIENLYYLERRTDTNKDYANKYKPVEEVKYVRT